MANEEIRHAHIMEAEDERVTAEDLRDILTQSGYVVTAAVANGQETARLLRQRFDIPVVCLTAHAGEETLVSAELSEPLGFVVKPFQEPELHATIEMALHKIAAERDSRLRQRHLEGVSSSTIERAIVLEEVNWVQPENPGVHSGHAPRSTPVMAEAALPAYPSPPSLEGMSLRQAEKTMLLGALQRTGWNQTQAAKVLDVTRDTLRYKMKKYNLKNTKSV